MSKEFRLDRRRFLFGLTGALALAALRWHGYRSDNRYLVFQCLQHTLGLAGSQWRVLDTAHKLRNRLEYEGVGYVDDRLLAEIIEITRSLLPGVERLRQGKTQ